MDSFSAAGTFRKHSIKAHVLSIANELAKRFSEKKKKTLKIMQLKAIIPQLNSFTCSVNVKVFHEVLP